MHIDVPVITAELLTNAANTAHNETSAEIKQRGQNAMRIQTTA